MIIINKDNVAHLSNEQLLYMAMEELANKKNYEPFEKDYGVGRPTLHTPYLAKHHREYAESILAVIKDREVRSRAQCGAPLKLGICEDCRSK